MALVFIRQCSSVLLLAWLLLLGACTLGPAPVPVEDRSRPAEPVEPPSDTTAYPDQQAVPPTAEPQPLPAPERSPSVTTDSETRTRQEPSPPAVVALLDSADQYMASGRDEQAQASIERALRIDPKNPKLWQRLSLVRLQQQRWDQAIATARKSNLLAVDDPRVRVDNWLIIAQALEAKGDRDGAEQAIAQARRLRR